MVERLPRSRWRTRLCGRVRPGGGWETDGALWHGVGEFRGARGSHGQSREEARFPSRDEEHVRDLPGGPGEGTESAGDRLDLGRWRTTGNRGFILQGIHGGGGFARGREIFGLRLWATRPTRNSARSARTSMRGWKPWVPRGWPPGRTAMWISRNPTSRGWRRR